MMICKSPRPCGLFVCATLFSWLLAGAASAGDWPMWRYDAGRTNVSPHELSEPLHAQWSRQLPPPQPAWPREQDYHGKLEFDVTYQPIVLGQRLIVPSTGSDRVTAYDTRSGAELWRFYADGPIRFAPAGSGDRVYFGSDDGHLYCLDAGDGRLHWKVRGGPDGRTVLGNERLISAWPVRGAPVVAEGRVYFGAGIWPFMGIFVHCVDAQSGATLWTNSGSGAIYNLHQHGGADAFGGIAPHGYMALTDDHLVVAGGLTVPAIFDRETGELLLFEQSHAVVGKGTGGFDVAAAGPFYFNGGRMFSIGDGKPRLSVGPQLPLLAADRMTLLHDGQLREFDLSVRSKERETTDRRGRRVTEKVYSLEQLAAEELSVKAERLLLRAGATVFVLLDDGSIAALRVAGGDQPSRLLWQRKVDGSVHHLLAGDQRLFIVTEEGTLYCLGAEETTPRHYPLPTPAPTSDRPPAGDDDESQRAEKILNESGQTRGIALVWGLDSGRLVEELLARSELTVIAVDDDAERVERLRRRLDTAQWYGRRAHVLLAEPAEFPFPPYLARLIVSERLAGAGWPRAAAGAGGEVRDAATDKEVADKEVAAKQVADKEATDKEATAKEATDKEATARFVRRLFHPLRPYGGAAWLPLSDQQHAALVAHTAADQLPGSQLARRGDFTTLTRVGALPGAGQWTHQYGNSANTVSSGDQRVKAPLGLLWFGGPTNRDALPRHGQGPVPQVAGGRLVIEGVNSLSARCVYTGRTLWRREFPDIGFPYKARNHSFTEKVYINNQPGANYIGSNYVSLPDGIYAVYQDECLRLDPETGATVRTFRLPSADGAEDRTGWGYLGVWGDYLVAGASPHVFDDQRIGEKNWNRTSSRRVVVMDRHSGKVLWTRDARYGFRHNAIVPAGDRLFLIDRLSEEALKLAVRRGLDTDDQPELLALDLATGKPLWNTSDNIFGTWLGYSEEHDVLIQGGRTGGREHLPDEPSRRIIAYGGNDGSVLWDEPIRYNGPLVILGDQVISSGRKEGALDLLTGQTRQRLHPVTGREIPWTHTRTYGCGTVLACENLLTFRSGAAGFFDFGSDGGTGNFGGFKAGCTPNLVPADGVLNAPDYTRTCTCSYQNQTSLAMIHQPDVEIWTYSTLPPPGEGEAVQRIGINFHAPGDRLADDGTLWVEYPSVSGPSPDIPIQIVGGEPTGKFRSHSSLLDRSAGDPAAPAWVAASGLEGAVKLSLTLEAGSEQPPQKSYTVRLHFAEPQQISAGGRVFDVSLQGQRVETGLDVVKTAGSWRRPLVREHRGVVVNDMLTIELHAVDDSRPPILSGIEIVRERP